MVTDIAIWFLQFVYFLLVLLVAFYLPGRFFLKKTSFDPWQKFVLALVIGMVLWGWQGFIFGYLNARWLTYGYLLFFLGNLLFEKPFLRIKFVFPQIDKLTAFLIGLGVVIQVVSTWFVGTKVGQGLYFCCGNTGDNTLYVSIINEIVRRFPPFEPGMFGVLLQNYHYWSALVIGELIRIFHLPLFPTSFQFFMLFLSLFLGLSAVVLSRQLALPKGFYRWFVFFLYFGGDAIILLLFLLQSSTPFSMSSLEDGAKFLSNPSRAFAIIVFFAGLTLFVSLLKKKDWLVGILFCVLMGSLVGFKVYVGFFALAGLGILSLYFLSKKQLFIPVLSLIVLVLSLLIYFPVNKEAGGLVYIKLWRFENFISQPALGLIQIDMAREVYLAHQNWIKVTLYESFYILLYFLAVFGTKLLGLVQTKKSLSLIPRELHILLLTGIFVSLVLGSFFDQTSGGANTFNFFVSIFIIGSFYTALACWYWLQRIPKKLGYIFIILVVLLTIPRVVFESITNVKNLIERKGYHVVQEELEGLIFIKEQTPPDSMLLIANHNFMQDKDSPYIGVLTNRPVFLSGIGNELQAHGIDYSEREVVEKYLFREGGDTKKIGKMLLDNHIDFLVMKNTTMLTSTAAAEFLEPVYNNGYMRVEKVSEESIRKYLQSVKEKDNEIIY